MNRKTNRCKTRPYNTKYITVGSDSSQIEQLTAFRNTIIVLFQDFGEIKIPCEILYSHSSVAVDSKFCRCDTVVLGACFLSLQRSVGVCLNPLNAELNPISYLLALLGAHHFLHISRIRVKLLTLRLLMSYIYGAPILDVSRSHATMQHSR